MFDLLKGQGGAKEARRVVIALGNTNVEMEANINGFCR